MYEHHKCTHAVGNSEKGILSFCNLKMFENNEIELFFNIIICIILYKIISLLHNYKHFANNR